MKKYIKSSAEIYASSMSRILSKAKTNHVATLTAFVTSDDFERPNTTSRQSKTQNKARNRRLSDDLQRLLYGFSRIRGQWAEGDEDIAEEESYYVICPRTITYEHFEEDMLRLAKIYEQQAVVIWNYELQMGYLYYTDDYKTYKIVETFHSLNVTSEIKEVWSMYKRNKFVFASLDDVFYVDSATEIGSIGGGASAYYGRKMRRKELFSEGANSY